MSARKITFCSVPDANFSTDIEIRGRRSVERKLAGLSEEVAKLRRGDERAEDPVAALRHELDAVREAVRAVKDGDRRFRQKSEMDAVSARVEAVGQAQREGEGRVVAALERQVALLREQVRELDTSNGR